jgi:hypothetical protein
MACLMTATDSGRIGSWPGALGGTRTPSLQIRRSGHIVQDRPSWSVSWAEVPRLAVRVSRCPATWQQRDGMARILDRPFFQVSQTAYSGDEVQA